VRAKNRYKKEGAKMRLQMAKLRELDYERRIEIERASRARRKEVQRPLKNARQQIRNRILASANKGILSSREIASLYNQPCQNCGSKANLSIDHIIPLARGGSHTIGNLMTLCKSCNSSKGKKLLVEWKQDLARMRGK
jgi:5-methylcytosine-specific restriction endonuclease McrA